MKRTISAVHLLVLITVSFTSIGQTRADDQFLGRSLDQWSEMLNSADENDRAYSAWAIGKLAEQSAGSANDHVFFAELVKLVNDNNPTVRYWGVLGLARYAGKLPAQDGGRTAVVNTVTALLEDDSAAPRIAAAQTLGMLGQPEKALPIIVAAMSDPQDSVRVQAASALEYLGPASRPATATLKKGATDSSDSVKRIAERSLEALDLTRKPIDTPAKVKKAN